MRCSALSLVVRLKVIAPLDTLVPLRFSYSQILIQRELDTPAASHGEPLLFAYSRNMLLESGGPLRYNGGLGSRN